MIFWDASAIVPLVLAGDESDEIHGVLRGDNDMLVWWGTPVEVLSALARAERSRAVPSRDVELARRLLRGLTDRWNEVQPSDEVRERAGTVLLRHPLRPADALQLAAALTWARGRPPGHAFVSLEARLAEAARREGFDPAIAPPAADAAVVDERARYLNLPASRAAALRTLVKSDFALSIQELHGLVFHHRREGR